MNEWKTEFLFLYLNRERMEWEVMSKIYIGRSIAAFEWNAIDLKFVPVNHNKNELTY